MAWRYVVPVSGKSGIRIWCYVVWMDGMTVCYIFPRVVRPSTFTYKTCGIGGNISMACGSSYHNIHHPDDAMVVFQFLANLFPQLRCFVACGLILWHSSVSIVSKACQTLPMHTKYINNVW